MIGEWPTRVTWVPHVTYWPSQPIYTGRYDRFGWCQTWPEPLAGISLRRNSSFSPAGRRGQSGRRPRHSTFRNLHRPSRILKCAIGRKGDGHIQLISIIRKMEPTCSTRLQTDHQGTLDPSYAKNVPESWLSRPSRTLRRFRAASSGSKRPFVFSGVWPWMYGAARSVLSCSATWITIHISD